jgi:hypothetical protein
MSEMMLVKLNDGFFDQMLCTGVFWHGKQSLVKSNLDGKID